MFFLGGIISDRLRGSLRNNDPSYSPPPEAGRTTTPRKSKIPKDVNGVQESKGHRKAKK